MGPPRAAATPGSTGSRGNSLRRGIALFRAGRLDEAEALGRRLLAARSNDPDALYLLGAIAFERKDPQRAVELLARAVSVRPDASDLQLGYGNALRDAGKPSEAIAAYERAVALDPQLASAHRNLGYALLNAKRIEDAGRALERAVRLCPDDAQAHNFLGKIYRQQSRPNDAVASYRKALSLNPELSMARLGACVAQLPIIYDSEEEIAECRAAYERSLLELCAFYDGKPPEVLAGAAEAVGSVQPFYLAYQGCNDRALQALYGGLMCRFMAGAYPQWTEPLPMPAPEPDGRFRVGILSGFFHRHSNWKIPIKGWAEQLDRSKLRLFGYYTGTQHDCYTTEAARAFERFLTGPISLTEWAETIRGDDLHVLIIPEVGMDSVSAQLSALRLAPVQCGSWGHPETSGFPTLDYFLSSELMEPDDGQDHYSERLVRLPNLSVHYTPPTQRAADYSRDALGLRPDSVAYWCCQSLFKYLPRFDDIFPRIAAGVGDCQFVFIRHQSDDVTRRFQARLARAFARFGLDDGRHCLFVERMSLRHFAAAMRSVDLFLDSLGWSGCNTTMEAIGVGLPVITCQGELMRGRHSAAILRMLGLDEAIAETPDAYVELAVALGRDADRREELRRQTLARHGRAYGDLACIRGLEDFLCGIAGSE